MKLKLDENLGEREARIFREAGHDVSTVLSQKLMSASDHELIRVCARETRCLVTMDMDFANPIVFPPREGSGIAVLRMPSDVSALELADGCRTLIEALGEGDISGKLWIVQRKLIREYQGDDDD